MATAYIVDAVRTAGGRRNGRLAGVHPVDLAAATLDAIVERTGIDGAAVDDVVMGCVSQGGQQAGQVGRNAVLAARRLPDSVPAGDDRPPARLLAAGDPVSPRRR
jgi:acetyl-CoA C-acetyltransferase